MPDCPCMLGKTESPRTHPTHTPPTIHAPKQMPMPRYTRAVDHRGAQLQPLTPSPHPTPTPPPSKMFKKYGSHFIQIWRQKRGQFFLKHMVG